MLVKNTGVSIIHLPFGGDTASELKLKLAKTKHAKGLTLLPGVNDVPAEAMEAFSNNKSVKRYFDDGLLETLEEAGKKDKTSILDMKEAQAKKVIRATMDRDLLMRWAGEEEREDVLSAIQAQLKKIAPPGADKDEKKPEPEGDESEKS
jgi:hypothetical protein